MRIKVIAAIMLCATWMMLVVCIIFLRDMRVAAQRGRPVTAAARAQVSIDARLTQHPPSYEGGDGRNVAIWRDYYDDRMRFMIAVPVDSDLDAFLRMHQEVRLVVVGS